LRALVVLLLFSIFSVDYFAVKLELVSRYATLVVELLSLLIALLVVYRSVSLRRWEQPPYYVWLIIAFVLSAMVAVVAETVDPGPLISGIRGYFKFLPVFFLAAVYRFTDKEIKFLLGIFLFIAALQVPLSFYQRFVQFAHRMHTGDPVTGTVASANSLTMILCMAIALVITLYVYKKLTLLVTLLLFGILAAPTAINETKATLVLLPIATIGPFIFASNIKNKWRKAAPVFGLGFLGLVSFIVIYDTLIAARWDGTALGEFLTAGHWEWYLYRGVDTSHSPEYIGRFDSILLPISFLSESWMQLLFGLGIGNVSPAFLPGMEGAYYAEYKDFGFGMTAAGNLIWETGLVGLCIYLAFFYFAFRDARRLSKSSKEIGWLGAWWSTCIFIYLFGLVYIAYLGFNELVYLLFLCTGLVSSRLWQGAHGVEEEAGKPIRKLELAGV